MKITPDQLQHINGQCVLPVRAFTADLSSDAFRAYALFVNAEGCPYEDSDKYIQILEIEKEHYLEIIAELESVKMLFKPTPPPPAEEQEAQAERVREEIRAITFD